MSGKQTLIYAFFGVCFLCIILRVAVRDGNLLRKPKVWDTVLRTRADGTFKIVQFTDLHFGESEHKDDTTVEVQGRILDAEDADLVVMTGDAVSGYAWSGWTPNFVAPLWKKLTHAMNHRKMRWAFTFGNHDDQADLTREEIMQLEAEYPLSLTRRGPADIQGVTNYYLPVYSYDTNNTVPVAILYMLDSSDVACNGKMGWGCVYPDQIAWYKRTSTHLRKKYGKVIPAMAFFHIPVPEFLTMWNSNNCSGVLKDTGVCCFSENTGLFNAFKEMGDVKSVHCGHDHNNDFYGVYEGITLAYGRKTGHGGYGPVDTLRGARILQFNASDESTTHWIRQEDGSRVDSASQPLHEPTGAHSEWQYCCDTSEALHNKRSASQMSNCAAYESTFHHD